jgi:recombination protein RecT
MTIQQTNGSTGVSVASQFRDQFSRMQGEIQSALPAHIPLDRFMRVVLTAVNESPDLLIADRRSPPA